MRAGEQHQGVAVWRRFRERVVREEARAAGLLLDDDGLAEALGEFLREEPADQIVARAGRRADEETDRPRGILLRSRLAGGERGEGHDHQGTNMKINRS